MSERPAEKDARAPKPCPLCGEVCTFDEWGHVHANGRGIAWCVAMRCQRGEHGGCRFEGVCGCSCHARAIPPGPADDEAAR